jgi:hypothetical protein
MSVPTPSIQYSMDTPDIINNILRNKSSGLYDASLNSTGLYISDINYKSGNGSLEFPKNTITFGTRSTITTPHIQNIGVAVSQDQLKMIVLIVGAANLGVHYAGRTSTANSFSAFTLVPSAPTNRSYRSCAMTTDGTRGVTCIYGNYVYVFFWAGNSSTAPSGWKQTLDTTTRNYEKVSITADGSRLVVSVWSGNIFISTWNSASSNYNVFTQSVITSFTTAISYNGDRLVYSNTSNDNWYLAFWNGTDYVGNTLVYTKTGDRHAFFSGDSSILFVTNFATNSFAYGTFNQSTKTYGNFQTPSPSTVVPDGNVYGFCFADGITSGTLYFITYGSTTMYVVPVNYTIQNTSTQTKFVTLPSFTTTNNGLTFACWFRSNYNQNLSRIFEFGNVTNTGSNNIILDVNNNGLRLSIFQGAVATNPNVVSSYNINNNTWYHIAITMTYAASGSATSNVIFYLNGVSISNTSNQFYYPPAMTRTLNYIGRSLWIDPEFFGNVDDFRVYNTVLTASEVNTILNDTQIQYSLFPLHYKFDTTDLSGTRIYNNASSLYDASLNSTGLYISDINYKVGNGSVEFPKNTVTLGTVSTMTGQSPVLGLAVSQDQLKIFVGIHGDKFYYSTRANTSSNFTTYTLIPNSVVGYYNGCAITSDGTRGVASLQNDYVYIFNWSSATPSGWQRTTDTTIRNYLGVALTTDGSRLIASTFDGIFFSNWNSNTNNYDVFTQVNSISLYGRAGVSSNGDRIVYGLGSYSAQVAWYISFWNGTNYSTGTAISGTTPNITNMYRTTAYFSRDSSILFLGYEGNTTTTIQYGKFNSSTKTYDTFVNVSTSTIPASLIAWGLCYVDDISSGRLYVQGGWNTTLYVLPINYTIQTSSAQTKFVRLPSFSTTNNGLTFTCWFRSNFNQNFARIFDFGNNSSSDNVLLGIYNNSLMFTIYQGSTTMNTADILSSYKINNNTWYHIAITMTYAASGSATSNVIFYLNGVSILNTSNQYYYPFAITRTSNFIGRSNWSTDPEFFGNVDDFRMYNIVLTASEVQTIYNNILPIPPPDANSYNFEKALSLDWNGQLFVLTIRKDSYMGNIYNRDYLYSYDGSTWITGTDISNSTLLVNKNPYNVKWLGNQYEIMGNITSTSGNTILKSRDGTTFSSIPANNSVPVYDLDANLEFNNTITFPKDVTLAFGGASADSTKIAYSLDGGISWTPSANSSSIFSNTVYNAAWNGKLWVAVGSGGNTIATSTDGSNWVGRGSYIFTNAGYTIIWSNEETMWVAGGEGTNSLAYSYDGVYWTGLGNTIVNPVYDVEWNGSIWVAAGGPITGNKSITYSYDGLNWQLPTQTNLFDISAQRLFWNGSFWTGIGRSTSNNGSYNMATSMDGITWNMMNNTAFTNEILTNMYANPKTNTTFFTSYSLATPPSNLAVTGSTSTTISISFTAPITTVTSYTVTAVPTSGSTVTQTFNAPATTYTITGLQQATTYTISVFTTNINGNSLPSTSVTFSTTLSPPTGLTATSTNNTTISISFTPPSATVNTYTVTAVPTTGTTVTQTFNAPATTYTITGLQTSMSYTISMTATSGTITSISSTTITSTTNILISNITFPDSYAKFVLSGSWTTDIYTNTVRSLNVSGATSHKNGTYTVSSSSAYAGYAHPYFAFCPDKTGDPWFSTGGNNSAVTVDRTITYLGYQAYNQVGYNSSGNYQGATGAFFTTSYTESGVSKSMNGEWIQIQFPYSMKLTQMILYPRTPNPGSLIYQSPKTGVILGSNDGSTWVLIHNYSVTSYPNITGPFTTTITTTVYYKYIRFVVNQLIGPSPNWWTMARLYYTGDILI